MSIIGKVCMVRTYSAGVFLGTVASRDGKEVTLTNARRIWYWAGAATLSQLATEGTSKPKECKFPARFLKYSLPKRLSSSQLRRPRLRLSLRCPHGASN